MTAKVVQYQVAKKRCERAYWAQLVRHPRATTYRAAALMAGVTPSLVWRKCRQYRLRLRGSR